MGGVARRGVYREIWGTRGRVGGMSGGGDLQGCGARD